jgi:flagellar L-ring protein precursor FlgH
MIFLGLLATTEMVLADTLATAAEPAVARPKSFFADRRAVDTGDVLTVVITEFATVTATAQTQTNKSESVGVNAAHSQADIRSLSAGLDGKSAGGGQIERSDKLIAKLAVTVRSVDSRGNLIVHGEQDIQLNNERQRICLDGFVRPEDIGADNTVQSWRVGDARIEFTGKGLLARKQSPGLINRVLSWFWE